METIENLLRRGKRAVTGHFQARRDREPVCAQALLPRRFPDCGPLPIRPGPVVTGGRLTVITDSISAGLLYGGVGTAMILGALMSQRTGSALRFVTRREAPQPANLDHVLAAYGIVLDRPPTFEYVSAHAGGPAIEVFDGEQFITTSWWTTAGALQSLPAENILYLLQEDERMFYPFGDERLLCERTFARHDIRYLVNTRLLFDHLIGTGLPHLADCGDWFEPAFPHEIFHPRPRPASARRRLLFYARPYNLRNLFYLGIEAIDRALEQGVLDADEWELVLVGRDIPNIVFSRPIECARFEHLSWTAYADVVGTVDLGLCLMYTPHPSYPPLDLAASGAVVVTNRHGLKQDLDRYSRNILCTDPETEAVVEALGRGIALAADTPLRERHRRESPLGSSWQSALVPPIDRVLRAIPPGPADMPNHRRMPSHRLHSF